MDRRILNLRLQRIEDELPKITNAILAMRITDTEKYPLNYEEVSTDAAIRAEKIACSLSGLIYAANIVPKATLMEKTVQSHGISISQEDGMTSITLPGLLPKKRKQERTTFLTDPLYYALECYVNENAVTKYGECVVCFSHVFNEELSIGRIRDYDNMECKMILDTIAAFLMVDDTGLLCNTYHTTEFGPQDCTVVTLMACGQFPDWLKSHEGRLKSMSDF